jgi:predicted RNase H-like nuclease (RuvC/YqgF family)
MAIPALAFELEEPVEERVTKLEVQVEHIQSDISEIKTDIRRLTDKVDAIDVKLTGKIDAVDGKLTGKIDNIMEILTSLKVGHAHDRVWWLLTCGAMLAVMARGFKWI